MRLADSSRQLAFVTRLWGSWEGGTPLSLAAEALTSSRSNPRYQARSTVGT